MGGIWGGASGVKNDGTVNPTNFLSNGDFENWSAGTAVAPDGWVAELTPTIARDTGDVGYGSYSAKITAVGEGLEGIKYTLSGLRASTTYSVSWRTKVTAGDTSQVLTTGAGTDLAATESTSTTFETKKGTFITYASGTAVVIKFMAKADTDIVWFDGVQVNQGESAFAFSDKPAGEGVWADYSAISTIAGFSAYTVKKIWFKKIGKLVFVNFELTGTSDAVGITFTVPYTSNASASGYYRNAIGVTTGGANTIGVMALNIAGNVAYCYPTFMGGNFTNGTTSLQGQFWYESV